MDDLTYREIGEGLGVSPPDNFEYKGDHPMVREMVAHGREILEHALVKEGWQEQIEAEALGTSYEEN